jgi:hypothetical protein
VARTHQADEADAELESILPEATDNELPRYVAG